MNLGITILVLINVILVGVILMNMVGTIKVLIVIVHIFTMYNIYKSKPYSALIIEKLTNETSDGFDQYYDKNNKVCAIKDEFTLSYDRIQKYFNGIFEAISSKDSELNFNINGRNVVTPQIFV